MGATIISKREILNKLQKTLPSSPPEDGLLFIDKPKGPTSHDIVSLVRKTYNIKKVGHAGTLDPLASGLLIVLVGRSATKKSADFLGLDKIYLTTGQLGQTTDSYDAEGQITSQAPSQEVQKITAQNLQSTIQNFQGSQIQKVPPFSSVKIDGKPLYKYAREGNPIPDAKLPAKQITVHSLELVSFEAPFFTIETHVSKGTFIRCLIHDVGQVLGVGAYVTDLRRTQIGPYKIPQK